MTIHSKNISRRAVQRAATLSQLLLLLLAATSCTEQQETAASDMAARIELTATVDHPADATLPTRATESDATLQNVVLQTSSVIDLYFSGGTVTTDGSTTAVDKGQATVTAANTTTGIHTLAVTEEGTKALYLRPGEVSVWIDAVYPKDAVNLAGAASQTFTVPQDQTTDANYRKADLMYGSVTALRTLPGGTATGQLQMHRRMVKLQLTVVRGLYVTEVKSVRLISGYRTCNFQNVRTLTPGTTLSDEITPGQPLTVTSTASTAATLTVSCIVPPQTLGVGAEEVGDGMSGHASRELIAVETNLGTTIFRLTQAQKLESGHVYTATLTPASLPGTHTVSLTAFGTVATGTQDASAASGANDIYYVGDQAFKMVKVEGGSYTTFLGQTVTGTLSDFYIGETEVTRGLWKAVGMAVPASGMAPIGDAGATTTYDQYPISYITWSNITAVNGFLDRLNALTESQRPAGWRFCLPSDAQWEYAARGGVHNINYTFAGSNTADDVAWYNGNSDGAAHPVAQLRPNSLGLYDMSGNVQEFVADYPPTPAANANLGLDYKSWDLRGGGAYGTTRNGSYGNGISDNAPYITIVTHHTTHQGTAHEHVGFRLCLRKVAVGDLYFSDGSWGTKQENPGKTAIAVVFSTETSEKDQKMGYRQGYAVALNEYGSGTIVTWGDGIVNTTQMTDVTYESSVEATQWANLTGDMDGLTHCLTAYRNAEKMGTWEIPTLNTMLTAINAARAYTPAAPAAKSSGWYLPSIGQCYQFVAAFAPTYADKSHWTFRNAANNQDFYISNTTYVSNILTAINSALDKAGTYTAFQADHHYWTSTEHDATRAFQLFINTTSSPQYTLNGPGTKTRTDTYVRPVLAF